AHLEGNCHSYIHESADYEKAKNIILNAKMRRTGICGATETLLVDKSFDKKQFITILQTLSDAGCEIRGCEETVAMFSGAKLATDEDWQTEYLSPILAVKRVSDINDAIDHIRHYSSGHTEAIIAENEKAAEIFLNKINSAIVLHNASTQFADGGEFGMGAEIGIATGKIHARGPVGLEQLTCFKYQVRGDGHIRPK
ncbi:MAG: aldehyde dehydrogenase family protein, partial [Pseudomonadota bacterium]